MNSIFVVNEIVSTCSWRLGIGVVTLMNILTIMITMMMMIMIMIMMTNMMLISRPLCDLGRWRGEVHCDENAPGVPAGDQVANDVFDRKMVMKIMIKVGVKKRRPF